MAGNREALADRYPRLAKPLAFRRVEGSAHGENTFLKNVFEITLGRGRVWLLDASCRTGAPPRRRWRRGRRGEEPGSLGKVDEWLEVGAMCDFVGVPDRCQVILMEVLSKENLLDRRPALSKVKDGGETDQDVVD